MKVSRLQGPRALVMIAGMCLASLTLGVQAATDFDPSRHEGARALVDELVGKGMDRDWLESAMRDADFQQGVLDAMAGAAERRLRWDEYRRIFMQPERIARGADFIEAHRDAFDRAEAVYGVPPR